MMEHCKLAGWKSQGGAFKSRLGRLTVVQCFFPCLPRWIFPVAVARA